MRTTRWPRRRSAASTPGPHERGLARSGRPHQGQERAPAQDGQAGGDVARRGRRTAPRRPTSYASSPSHGHRPVPARGCVGTSSEGSCRRIDCSRATISGRRVDAELAGQHRPELADASGAPRPARRCGTARARAAPSDVHAAGRTAPARARGAAPRRRGRISAGHPAAALGRRGAAPPGARPRARGRPLRQLLERRPPPQLECLLEQERHPVGLAELQQLRAPASTCASNRRASTSSSGTASRYPSRRRLDGVRPPAPCAAGRCRTGDSCAAEAGGWSPQTRRPARRRSRPAQTGGQGLQVRRGLGGRDVPSRPRPADRGPGCPPLHGAPRRGTRQRGGYRTDTAAKPGGYRVAGGSSGRAVPPDAITTRARTRP